MLSIAYKKDEVIVRTKTARGLVKISLTLKIFAFNLI